MSDGGLGEVLKRFEYVLEAGHLGTMPFKSFKNLPQRVQLGLLEYMPKTIAQAAPYLEGRARLPPYRIDWQGQIRFELSVPWVAPSDAT